MQVEPQQTIPLVYNLTDPGDSTVYYVRAVVRDSLTGSTLSTKDLTSAGSGRYTGSYTAPFDGSGNGRHIDITISVYTDSGHTTVSTVYIRSLDKYIVRTSPRSFGGGGMEVDYDKIRKIISALIMAKFGLGTEKDVFAVTPTDLSPLVSRLNELHTAIEGIDIPEVPPQIPVDLGPVLRAIHVLGQAVALEIGEINIPKPEKLDLSPVITAVKSLADQISALQSLSEKQKTDLKTAIQNMLAESTHVDAVRTEKIQQLIGELIQSPGVPAPAKKPNNPILSKYFPTPS